MPISKESLRGYILEEVLAFLIRQTGYKLLTDKSQDTRDLDNRGNGLVIKGRGGIHQVDVLGQLEWIPAFTFPLRLFIEAKFRKNKTGIDVVRNAIGVALDINQNNSPTREEGIFPQRYHYAHALFSTSGFSKYAVDMALAHQVSLIDLSGQDFINLRRTINQVAEAIIESIDTDGELTNIDDEDLDDQTELSRGGLVKRIRNTLRIRLSTLPTGIENQDDFLIDDTLIAPIINEARNYNELFVAMANGPYMLILKADNPGSFIRYAAETPRHRVTISWNTNIDNGETWLINPTAREHAYQLSFKLPEILKRWVFDTSENIRQRALQVKQEALSAITIYRFVQGRDQLFRLEFDIAETLRRIN